MLTWTENWSLLNILEVFEASINPLHGGSLSCNSLQVFVLKTADHELCCTLTLITDHMLFFILMDLFVTWGAIVINLNLFLMLE